MLFHIQERLVVVSTRLAKKIAENTNFSRRKAESLIAEGRVTVNGHKIIEQGFKVEQGDAIKVDGKLIKQAKKIYLLFNKPKNVISTTTDLRGRETVMDYLLKDEKVHPVGRLDFDTTGLMLMTNDGELTNYILHPKNKIYKTYRAKIDGILLPEEIIRIKKGVATKWGTYAPAKIKIRTKNLKTNTSIVDISVYEGKYHEVKNIFKHFGKEVLSLDRIAFGFLSLGKLPRGAYRKLKKEEIERLRSLYRYEKKVK